MHNLSRSGEAVLSDSMTGQKNTYQVPRAFARTDPIDSTSIAFWFGMGLVFVRFSMVNEILTYVTHHNFYLLYLFGLPTIIGLLARGGIARVLRSRAAIFWMCLGLWMFAAIPFSIWRGGSFHAVVSFWKTELLMLFVVGGLTSNWRELRILMLTIAAGTATSLLWTRIFLKQAGETGRMSLEVGTISNANDFAGFLLLGLPFLVWVVMSGRRPLARLAAFVAVSYGLYAVLACGSRGALLGIAAALLFFTFAARTRHRVTFWLVIPVIALVAFVALPQGVTNRLLSFSASRAGASAEALGSSRSREILLRDSITASLRNPLFGIGPGQFTTYEGTKPELRGTGAYWHGAHNAYTQMASECGIPALLFYIAAIWSSWRLLKVAAQRAGKDPRLVAMRDAIFCVRLALVGFCTAIFFLNFAYIFYLPAMTGMAIAADSVSLAATRSAKETS